MRETFKHLEPSFLFEYEKGGGNGGMMMMMYMMQQQQQQEAARQKAAEDKAAADKLAQEKEAKLELEGKKTASGQKLDKAMAGVIQQASDQLTSLGYTGAAHKKLLDDFTNKVTTSRQSAPDIVDNANDYFSTKDLTGIMDMANTGYQNQYKQQLDPFLGQGFETKAFADTADDAFIDAILGKQYGEAESALNASLARGAINDFGFSQGMGELSRQRAAGRSEANRLGLGVLGGYRTGLKDYSTDVFADLANNKYGDPFDVEGYKTGVGEKIKGYQGQLEGDIEKAIGGTNFFDVAKLLGKAGSSGGVVGGGLPQSSVTAATPNSLAPIEDRSLTDEEQRRKEGLF